jgi:hypothetical protein
MAWDSNPSKRFLLLPNLSDGLWGAPSAGPGLKQLGCVVYSPLSSTEVKNDWSYTSASPMCCYGMDKDNYTFYLSAFVLVLIFFLILKNSKCECIIFFSAVD